MLKNFSGSHELYPVLGTAGSDDAEQAGDLAVGRAEGEGTRVVDTYDYARHDHARARAARYLVAYVAERGERIGIARDLFAVEQVVLGADRTSAARYRYHFEFRRGEHPRHFFKSVLCYHISSPVFFLYYTAQLWTTVCPQLKNPEKFF